MLNNSSNEINKKRIIFILGSMGKGGAERVISILANEYANKGWYVDILMLLENRCDYKLHPNVKLVPIVNNNKNRIQQLPLWLSGIRKHITKNQPDKIISFVARINIITILACIGLTDNIIISERNDPKSDGRSLFVQFATYILYPLSEKVVFQTKWAQSCFPKKIRENSIIIYNPITVTKLANRTNSKKIVSVGRLAEQKNHILLIEAFVNVNKLFPDYTLHIFGEGNLRNSIEQRIREHNLIDRIILEGSVPNIHDRISDAEMFVLSSDYEGLSNALLEAMMMGLPCVSTNCAGSNEVISHNVNGLLVPIGDLNSLSESIIRLIQDKEFANQLANNAVKDSVNFSSRNILRQWEMIIENDYN